MGDACRDLVICLDPGHGMSNRKNRLYDPGATAGDVSEANIVMKWANCLRGILLAKGHSVVRTRKDAGDPAPVGQRAGIAKEYGCEIMLSLHCNAADGNANGTETFYRGDEHSAKAEVIIIRVDFGVWKFVIMQLATLKS